MLKALTFVDFQSHNSNSFNTYIATGESVLGDLPYAGGAGFDPAKACLQGTRTELIGTILDWVEDPVSQQILWLHGHAGSGKKCLHAL